MYKNDKRQRNGKTKTTIDTDKVKELREKLELTQKDFAETVEISAQLISKIERKAKGLSLDVALKIAEKFNVTLDYLFGRSDNVRDEATKVYMYLKKYFCLTFDEDGKFPIIQVDNNLKKFIEDVRQTDEVKKKLALRDNVYQAMIDGFLMDYNQNMKNNPDCGTTNLAISEYTIETVGVNVAHPPFQIN